MWKNAGHFLRLSEGNVNMKANLVAESEQLLDSVTLKYRVLSMARRLIICVTLRLRGLLATHESCTSFCSLIFCLRYSFGVIYAWEAACESYAMYFWAHGSKFSYFEIRSAKLLSCMMLLTPWYHLDLVSAPRKKTETQNNRSKVTTECKWPIDNKLIVWWSLRNDR